jgi:hypothetical protein
MSKKFRRPFAQEGTTVKSVSLTKDLVDSCMLLAAAEGHNNLSRLIRDVLEQHIAQNRVG